MFGTMRQSTKSAILLVVIGAMAVSMVFFGIVNDQGQTVGGAAAKVNGETIHMKDFRNYLRMSMRSFEGQEVPTQMMNQLRGRTLESLISQKLQTQLARRHGLRVSSLELRDAIISNEAFHHPEKKQFDKDVYRETLRSRMLFSPLLPYEFETLIEEEKLSEQLRDKVQLMNEVSLVAGRDDYQLENTKFVIRYAEVKPEHFPPSKEPTPEELKAFIEKTENASKVDDYYTNNAARFRKERETEASHILFAVLPGAAQDVKDVQKKKATEALEEMKKGLKWNEAVSRFSDDSQTRSTNGYLGKLTSSSPVKRYNQPMPQLYRALAGKKSGEISEIVESSFGFHILKVNSVVEEVIRAKDDPTVRMEIAKNILIEEQNQSAFETKRNELLAQIKDLKSLETEVKAKLKGAELKSSGEVSLNDQFIPGLRGDWKELMEFLVTANQGDACPKMYQSDTTWIACAIEKVNLPNMKEFDEKSDELLKGIAQSQSYYAFSYVLKKAQETARIDRNSDIFEPEENAAATP